MDRARHITSKVARAAEHLDQLRREISAFYEARPYKVAHRRDETSKRLIYYVNSVASVPDHIALVAGDVLQNLMSALDHLAYQLICSDTADKPPNPRWIYFPIADTQKDFEAKKAGKMAGASADTLAAIDALQPYSSGNKALWRLYRLNNIDKHRLLLTAGSQAAGIHLGHLMAPLVKGTFPPEAVEWLKGMPHFLMPADKGFPLQPGFELYVSANNEEPNPELPFRFVVALNEAEVVEGDPLVETLAEISNAVDTAIAALLPRIS